MPGAGEQLLVKRLRQSADRRVMESTDPAKLGTALTFTEMFSASLPSRPLFMKRGGEHDSTAAAYNAETFQLLAEFIRERGSIRPGFIGKTLAADTIRDYCGTLAAAINALTGARLTVPWCDTRRNKQMKSMLVQDGPKSAGERGRRLGFRARLRLPVFRLLVPASGSGVRRPGVCTT